MINFKRAFIGILLFASGCASTIPYRGASSLEQLGKDIGIPASDIIYHDRCLVGLASASQRVADRYESIYVGTVNQAWLIDYDSRTRKFRKALRLDIKTDGVGLAQHSSLLGKLYQVQVAKGDGHIVIEFVNADFGQLGHQEMATTAYEHLKKLGLKDLHARDYVERKPGATTVYIPIYVGR